MIAGVDLAYWAEEEEEMATELTKRLVTKESHIPMPTRLADLMTHEIRRAYKNGEL